MSITSALRHEYAEYVAADQLAQQQADVARAQQIPQEAQEASRAVRLDRRTVVRAGLAVATTAAIEYGLPDTSIKDTAEWVGEQLDNKWESEKLMPNPIIALEVREDNTPIVEPKRRGESIAVGPSFSEGGVLRFAPNIMAEAEHVPYQNLELGKGTFTTAGVGILTTAEGLVDGKQEFAEIFEDKTTGQVVAVGFEGGLYVYKKELGKAGGTVGEWVCIVTRPDKNGPPSALISGKTWEEMQNFMPEKVLIERVAQGTDTLRRLGYQAFGAVLPTTQMPEMKQITLSPENCVSSIAELAAGTNKEYLITEVGDIIGLSHLRAKPEETLEVYSQLLYQVLSGEKNPTVRVNYTRGSKAYYEFSIDSSALTLDNIADMTSSIMDTVTMLMEGVTQRAISEKLPNFMAEMLPAGHFGTEDPFTNTIGKNTMLEVIQELGITGSLTRSLQELFRQNMGVPTNQMYDKIRGLLKDLSPTLVRITIDKIAHERGVRAQKESVTQSMPLGIYHEIPNKVSMADAKTPTLIHKEKAGLSTKNAAAHRYSTTNIPVAKAMLGHVANKIAKK